MRILTVLFLALVGTVSAQFGFFEQMFGGGGGGQQQQQPQNVPSDSEAYRTQYLRSHCDKYLCPDTLGMLDCSRAPFQLPTPRAPR